MVILTTTYALSAVFSRSQSDNLRRTLASLISLASDIIAEVWRKNMKENLKYLRMNMLKRKKNVPNCETLKMNKKKRDQKQNFRLATFRGRR